MAAGHDLSFRQLQIALLNHQNNIMDLLLYMMRKKCSKRRRYWVRMWIARRQEFGIYDQLMVELRTEDEASFINFLRMPPLMFDELLNRIGHRIAYRDT